MANGIEENYFQMWKTDFSKDLYDHIIIFGDIECLPTLIQSLRGFTNKLICFVSDKQ